MHGLVVGLGSAASHVTPSVLSSVIEDAPDAKVEHFTDGRAVSVMILAPRSSHAPPLVAWARGGRLGLAVEGYLVLDAPGPLTRQVAHLLGLIEERGLESALGSVLAGAFNLALVDLDARTFTVANDRLGPIPLYYAETSGGCLVSTLPSCRWRPGPQAVLHQRGGERRVMVNSADGHRPERAETVGRRRTCTRPRSPFTLL